MAAKDRDLLALLETVAPARGTDWLGVLTRTLNSDPGAVERAYGVYACLDELAGSPADDPRVEATAQAAAIRRAVGLIREARCADRPAGSPEGNQP